MTRLRRIGFSVGAVGLVVAGVIYSMRPTPLEVDTAVVVRGTLRVTIDEEGTTRVRDHQDVNAPVSGVFVPAGVRVGDRVARGAVLGTIQAAPFDAEGLAQARSREGSADAVVKQAEAGVTTAQAALEDGQRTLVRRERLAQSGGVSAEEVERARTSVVALTQERDAARSRVDAARNDLAAARAALGVRSNPAGGARPVRAPIAGVVLRMAEEHERVLAAGTPLAQVGNPADLELVVPLLTADAARVKPGTAMRVTSGAGNDTLAARVTVVEPAAFTRLSPLGVEEQRVNVIGRLSAPASGLGDAFRIDASITLNELRDVLIVPGSALVRHGTEWTVFVASGGRAARRTVTLGARGGEFAQVIDGLAAGDTVIVYPGDKLADRAAIRHTTK